MESGPPPIKLSNGDYLFFYNSAQIGFPHNISSSYNVGFLILDKNDVTNIKYRCKSPILSPKYKWEFGLPPYQCNVPRVIFLEGAIKLNKTQIVQYNDSKCGIIPNNTDLIRVYFNGGDAHIGTAIIMVNLTGY